MKFLLAAIGAFSAFIFKYYNTTPGETRINFFWEGFWFTIISSLGGVFIIGPKTAFNSFIAGLLGWSAIANVVKQENEGASGEEYTDKVLSPEEIKTRLKESRDE